MRKGKGGRAEYGNGKEGEEGEESEERKRNGYEVGER